MQRLWRAREVIEKGYREPLSLALLSQHAAYSPFHFQRLYCSAFGESPQEHLARRRFEEARRLLRCSTLPVIEIAYQVGYESPASFTNAFRARTGYPPCAYRAEMRARSFLIDMGHLFVPSCFLAACGGFGVAAR
jgi:AraC family transcriptional regulator